MVAWQPIRYIARVKPPSSFDLCCNGISAPIWTLAWSDAPGPSVLRSAYTTSKPAQTAILLEAKEDVWMSHGESNLWNSNYLEVLTLHTLLSSRTETELLMLYYHTKSAL
jgi:hypothetical protein